MTFVVFLVGWTISLDLIQLRIKLFKLLFQSLILCLKILILFLVIKYFSFQLATLPLKMLSFNIRFSETEMVVKDGYSGQNKLYESMFQ